ncbi:hypothetical protein AGIG_G8136 [Arapaima gigas]
MSSDTAGFRLRNGWQNMRQFLLKQCPVHLEAVVEVIVLVMQELWSPDNAGNTATPSQAPPSLPVPLKAEVVYTSIASMKLVGLPWSSMSP